MERDEEDKEQSVEDKTLTLVQIEREREKGKPMEWWKRVKEMIMIENPNLKSPFYMGMIGVMFRLRQIG